MKIGWTYHKLVKPKNTRNTLRTAEERSSDWKAEFNELGDEHKMNGWEKSRQSQMVEDFNKNDPRKDGGQWTWSMVLEWEISIKYHYFCENQQITEYEILEEDWLRDGPFFVVEYESSQHYGGPEEGGWWYHSARMNRWTMLGNHAAAEALVDILNKKSVETVNPDAYRMLGGDETVNSTYPEGYIPSGWSDKTKRRYSLEHFPGLDEYDGSRGGWDGEGY
jgi:hypothetical protein